MARRLTDGYLGVLTFKAVWVQLSQTLDASSMRGVFRFGLEVTDKLDQAKKKG